MAIGKKSFGNIFKTFLQCLFINDIWLLLLLHPLFLCCIKLVLKMNICRLQSITVVSTDNKIILTLLAQASYLYHY